MEYGRWASQAQETAPVSGKCNVLSRGRSSLGVWERGEIRLSGQIGQIGPRLCCSRPLIGEQRRPGQSSWRAGSAAEWVAENSSGQLSSSGTRECC